MIKNIKKRKKEKEIMENFVIVKENHITQNDNALFDAQSKLITLENLIKKLSHIY